MKKKWHLPKYNRKKIIGKSCMVYMTASVVRVPGYRSRGPGSIPGTSIFSEK
jgi:hypothetical protein